MLTIRQRLIYHGHRTEKSHAFCWPLSAYLPMRATTHSCWHRGHLLFCFTHSAMQQLWNEWLQSPHTTTHSSCLFSPWHRRQASAKNNIKYTVCEKGMDMAITPDAMEEFFLGVSTFGWFWAHPTSRSNPQYINGKVLQFYTGNHYSSCNMLKSAAGIILK